MKRPQGTRLKRGAWAGLLVVVLVVVVVAAWWWLRQPIGPDRTPSASPPLSLNTTPAAAPGASAVEPGIRHPVDAVAGADAPTDLRTTLVDLFGAKATLSMFQLDDFPRRVAATVDNLGRSSASPRLWPVNPAAGRFSVELRDGGVVVSPDNSLRYTSFVLLLETVDLRRAMATYARLYPQIQKAYEDLGYPGRYFNDRLVDVIDQMLAAPEPEGALRVHLPAIGGAMQPERRWVLYEFDDPKLEALSSGQRILLRMGPVNERRMKVKLAQIRSLLTAGR